VHRGAASARRIVAAVSATVRGFTLECGCSDEPDHPSQV
jgi:hypothetical protein